jgi:hypothetical protein
MAYIERLKNNNFVGQSRDHGTPEFMPGLMQQRNIFLKTFSHTYYFSYSSGERKRKFMKQREVLKEPRKTVDMAVGFELDALRNLRLTGSIRRERNQGKMILTFKERLYAFFKCVSNPLSLLHKAFLPDCDFRPPKRLDNLFNPNMNNIDAIDYQKFDFCGENDGVLMRYSAEFPRLSPAFESKTDV